MTADEWLDVLACEHVVERGRVTDVAIQADVDGYIACMIAANGWTVADEAERAAVVAVLAAMLCEARDAALVAEGV
jgi:hypothetical protein